MLYLAELADLHTYSRDGLVIFFTVYGYRLFQRCNAMMVTF